MVKFTRGRGEQIRRDVEKSDRRITRRMVNDAVERGHEKIMDGDLAGLARILSDVLLPRLNVSKHTVRDAAIAVRDADHDLAWDHESVRRFVDAPERYVNATNPGGNASGITTNDAYLRAASMTDPRDRKRRVIVQTFESMESLAIARGLVSNSVTNWAPAFGYRLKIGTWYQPVRDDMPHEIQLVNPSDSEPVTVNMGKPGRGKGVAGHTETEDRYRAGRKIVDVVDFEECEGAVYDIPMSNPTLREVREDMGLPPDFTEHEDYDRPEMEIMVPLTENLAGEYIPYHGDGPRDTVVKPFTVPASSLSKRALKRFIASELTDTQTQIFESAYDDVVRSHDDWSLKDLIWECENHRGLHGNQGAVDRVQRSINRIAKKGWVRDKSDPDAIDWERILTDQDTITVFTASLMDEHDEAAKYLFHSYLIYALRTELKSLKKLPEHVRQNRDWNHVPPLTAIFRELHNIAPNSETAEDDDSIREVQDAMASDFRDLTAMHRHESVEIIGDTQNFIGEIKKRARVNFNRAVLFNVNFSPAKSMFVGMAGEPRDDYPRRVTKRFSVGEAAFLGRVGTDRSFEMTVHVAPPLSHHFDPDEWVHLESKRTMDSEDLEKKLGQDPIRANPEGWRPVNSGWDLRVYLLGEEYRPARELLNASNRDDLSAGEDLDALKTESRRPDTPVGQWAWDTFEVDETAEPIPHTKIMMTQHAWADTHGGKVHLDFRTIGIRLKDMPAPGEDEQTFGEVMEKRHPVMHDYPDGKYQTRSKEGIRIKPDREWLDCCDEPEFEIVWKPHPDDEKAEKGAKEPDTWRCENCGASGHDDEYQGDNEQLNRKDNVKK